MAFITGSVVRLLGLPNFGIAGSAALTADSSLSAEANATFICSVSMSAETSLDSDVVRVTEAVAMESSQSSLTADAVVQIPASSSLSAETDLVGNGGLIFGAESSLTSDSALTSTAIRAVIASAVSMSAESSTPNVATLPIYRLVLPTIRYSITNNILFSRYPIDVGQSLLISAGVGSIVENADQDTIRLSDYYFGGGRHHQLNSAEFDAVSNAGYGDLVEIA